MDEIRIILIISLTMTKKRREAIEKKWISLTVFFKKFKSRELFG